MYNSILGYIKYRCKNCDATTVREIDRNIDNNYKFLHIEEFMFTVMTQQAGLTLKPCYNCKLDTVQEVLAFSEQEIKKD